MVGQSYNLYAGICRRQSGKVLCYRGGSWRCGNCPPDWAHSTISLNPDENMTFGAWCNRDYGFKYDKVRKHRGLAWFPTLDKSGKIKWVSNSRLLAEMDEFGPTENTVELKDLAHSINKCEHLTSTIR